MEAKSRDIQAELLQIMETVCPSTDSKHWVVRVTEAARSANSELEELFSCIPAPFVIKPSLRALVVPVNKSYPSDQPVKVYVGDNVFITDQDSYSIVSTVLQHSVASAIIFHPLLGTELARDCGARVSSEIAFSSWSYAEIVAQQPFTVNLITCRNCGTSHKAVGETTHCPFCFWRFR